MRRCEQATHMRLMTSVGRELLPHLHRTLRLLSAGCCGSCWKAFRLHILGRCFWGPAAKQQYRQHRWMNICLLTVRQLIYMLLFEATFPLRRHREMCWCQGMKAWIGHGRNAPPSDGWRQSMGKWLNSNIKLKKQQLKCYHFWLTCTGHMWMSNDKSVDILHFSNC